MNDIETPKKNGLQIVAVVFCSFHSPTMQLRMKEDPYFYLDTIGLSKGNYALVHNGSEFAVVRVVRVFASNESVAVPHVSKPILAPIHYDVTLIKDAAEKLVDYREKTTEHRIEDAIDRKLGVSGIVSAVPSFPERKKTRAELARERNDIDLDVDEEENPF